MEMEDWERVKKFAVYQIELAFKIAAQIPRHLTHLEIPLKNVLRDATKWMCDMSACVKD